MRIRLIRMLDRCGCRRRVRSGGRGTGVRRHAGDTEWRRQPDPGQLCGRRRRAAARAEARRWPRGRRRKRRQSPAPGDKKGKGIPEEAAQRRRRSVERVAGSSAELSLSIPGLEPPRPAARQRRQPVLARAARPGALRRQRFHRRGRQQRAPRVRARRRARADRRRRTSTRSSATRRRSTGRPGPSVPNVIDPVCHYDPDNNRFMVVITTLPRRRRARFNGKNTIDLAVSKPATRPASGRSTTCRPRTTAPTERRTTAARSTAPRPGRASRTTRTSARTRTASTSQRTSTTCSGPAYNAAQVFAFSKTQLAAHPASITGDARREPRASTASPGFTVWPATSNAGRVLDRASGGTEYFLSTIAGDGSETGNPTGTARRIGLWAMTNTASLEHRVTPSVGITSRLINSEDLRLPAEVGPEAGRHPARRVHQQHDVPDALRRRAAGSMFFDPPEPAAQRGRVDARLGRHPHAADVVRERAAVGRRRHRGRTVGKDSRPASPGTPSSRRSTARARSRAQVRKQGYLALADNNLTYPAIAMGANGKGVIAFTVMGRTTSRARATP